MANSPYEVPPKDLIAIQIFKDYENLSVISYSQKIFEKTGILLELMNALHESKIKIPNWKYWSEAIIYKMCYHTSSLIKLCLGTELPYKRNNIQMVIFDEPSIITLFRTIFENYLTFFYLYLEDISDDDKQFRVLIWRYSGIKQRTDFDITSFEAKTKQTNELKIVLELKNEIENSKLFQSSEAGLRKNIIRGVKPRLKSWTQLIKDANFRKDLFGNLYGFKSNYAHTEFISILQMSQGAYGFSPEIRQKNHFLFILHMLICRSICDLAKLFPTLEELLMSKDENLRIEIYLLGEICTSKWDTKNLSSDPAE